MLETNLFCLQNHYLQLSSLDRDTHFFSGILGWRQSHLTENNGQIGATPETSKKRKSELLLLAFFGKLKVP